MLYKPDFIKDTYTCLGFNIQIFRAPKLKSGRVTARPARLCYSYKGCKPRYVNLALVFSHVSTGDNKIITRQRAMYVRNDIQIAVNFNRFNEPCAIPSYSVWLGKRFRQFSLE